MKKKHVITIIIAAFISVVVLTICLVRAVDSSNNYEISIKVDYGSDVYELYKLEAGESLLLLKTPVKEGYEFVGWYADKDYTEEFDFDAEIRKDTTIYAKMKKVGA